MNISNTVMVIGLFGFLLSMGIVILYCVATNQPKEIEHTVVEIKEVKVKEPTQPKVATNHYMLETKISSKEVEKKEVIHKKVKKKAKPKIDSKIYLLAQLINAEAKGEPYNGKVAVGNVVMNRVRSDKFPDTIRGVIFQRGQFSPVSNGSIYNKPSKESIRAAKDVMNGKKIFGDNVLFFYNPNTSTSSWILSRETVKDIGKHRFAY